MRFQTYRRVKRGAVTALVLVPVAALGAVLLPANAQDGKIKEPGKVVGDVERVDQRRHHDAVPHGLERLAAGPQHAAELSRRGHHPAPDLQRLEVGDDAHARRRP